MRIAVIGAGALGTLFGGLLADDGNDAWLLHHDPGYADEIDRNGVEIESTDGDVRRVAVPATADAARVGPADLAIVLVRSHQTVGAIREHGACIGPDTRALSLQNGLSNHRRLAEAVGEGRALSGVTYQGATLSGPGRVTRTAAGPSVFGGSDRAFAERVGRRFEAAGIGSRVVSDPLAHVWEKQLWGVAIKPVAALTRLPNRDLLANEGTAAVMKRLMSEAEAVAAARGVDVDADGAYDDLVGLLSSSTHRSSMLEDVEAGRRTEIDDVNGAVVDLADEEGIEVPYNRMATALVRGLERSYGE